MNIGVFAFNNQEFIFELVVAIQEQIANHIDDFPTRIFVLREFKGFNSCRQMLLATQNKNNSIDGNHCIYVNKQYSIYMLFAYFAYFAYLYLFVWNAIQSGLFS